MKTFLFDHAVPWQTLEGIEHLHCAILDIDRQNRIIDVLFKFAARAQIVLHRYKALNHMLVIQGEHRLYKADGRLKEIRPSGRYAASPASDEAAIVFFSIRGSEGVLYEILDDDLNVIATLTMQDFIDLHSRRMQR